MVSGAIIIIITIIAYSSFTYSHCIVITIANVSLKLTLAESH